MAGAATGSQHVPAGADVVFEQLVDFSNLPAWDALVEQVERLDDGPVRVGSEFDAVARHGRVRMPVRYRVVELDRPSHAVLVGEGARFREVDVIDLTEEDGGTLLQWCVTVESLGRAGDTGGGPIPSAVPRGSLTQLAQWLGERIAADRAPRCRGGS